MVAGLGRLFIVLSLSLLIHAFPVSTFFSLFFGEDNVGELSHIMGSKPVEGDSPLLVCDIEEPQLIEIAEINLSPNPPVKGSTLNITAKGFVLEEITEGAFIDVEVRLGYIKILSKTFDLCEQLEENDIEGLKCPIAPGYYELSKSVDIPSEVPPGKYNVVARAYTEDVDELTCITGDIIFPSLF